MPTKTLVNEMELGPLAKKFRAAAGHTKSEAARDMKVNRTTLHLAEEDPTQSLTKLRRRIIEKYSDFNVVGPLYLLRRKNTSL